MSPYLFQIDFCMPKFLPDQSDESLIKELKNPLGHTNPNLVARQDTNRRIRQRQEIRRKEKISVPTFLNHPSIMGSN